LVTAGLAESSRPHHCSLQNADLLSGFANDFNVIAALPRKGGPGKKMEQKTLPHVRKGFSN
jgi:hypothetical protein